MYTDILLLIIGFVFLVKGADVLVDGASSIARRFGLSAFFIGLTIVAFGTSLPELLVSVIAGIKGSSGIALGNVIGSNLSNTLLILGVSAVLTPLLVRKTTVDKEIPLSLLALFAFGFLVNDALLENDGPNSLTRIDGLILILFFLIFIFYTFGISQEKESALRKAVDEIQEKGEEYKAATAVGMIIAGIAGLYLGGRWIVDSGIAIAGFFHISEAMVGLTIVAIGTSLPELAASAAAAYKKKSDIAVGNVIGSNIFNLFWILGLASILRPIPFEFYLNIDLIILILATVLLIILVYVGRKNILDRREGIILISLYVLYLGYIIFRG